MRRAQKAKIIEKLKEKLAKAKSFVLTDYKGLTHPQIEEIKRAVKNTNAEFIITKNTLLRLCLNEKYQDLVQSLSGPTATLFSYDDEISPLTVLVKYNKTFGLPNFKIGILNNKILSQEELIKVASLPPKEVLLGNLTTGLNSPLFKLCYSLNFTLTKLVLILKTLSNKQ